MTLISLKQKSSLNRILCFQQSTINYVEVMISSMMFSTQTQHSCV